MRLLKELCAKLDNLNTLLTHVTTDNSLINAHTVLCACVVLGTVLLLLLNVN